MVETCEVGLFVDGNKLTGIIELNGSTVHSLVIYFLSFFSGIPFLFSTCIMKLLVYVNYIWCTFRCRKMF